MGEQLPRFSVIVCTQDRPDILRDAITSILQQDYSVERFELVVVENLTILASLRCVEELAENSRVDVKYILESQRGVSRSRNAGARASSHEVLAFMDDDAVAEADWLAALASAYVEGGPEVVCLAGLTKLIWEGSPPAWFPEDLYPYLSSSEFLGTEQRTLALDEYPVGTNFSIRKKQLVDLGGFREDLTPYINDEIDLSIRLRHRGYSIEFVPEALVHHRVPRERVSLSPLLRRAYLQGISDVLLEQGLAPRSGPGLVRSSIALVGQALGNGTDALMQLLRAKRPAAFRRTFEMAGRLGRLRAQVRLLRA